MHEVNKQTLFADNLDEPNTLQLLCNQEYQSSTTYCKYEMERCCNEVYIKISIYCWKAQAQAKDLP